ncbi:enoyl-CoA hydratase [Nocardia sp. 852002-20019_SCH5090214]|uniref:enoyl-CoA hydratase-related protein n=1 Tax=Nocardia TaxID=1817 RepID=UPI0007EBF417|nr:MULTISPECIES: enoyl-CoA hydratase-related protein [Nocardia]OBF66728.1 enoyl-CoA hydratase [Mycobacterium sp. 852002-51759_SCH5129042]MBF6277507.1 enoyl-CoA hydratase/isomerase family protein [Nocardia nova]OBA51203.1 enoyl-CoA hydratase [Nocardia sp. 852002-20019_SCH5090214]OBA53460.1 enoyl-CoA hydratase [Nocardia sp. 852002-51101_SCH5132738]OBB47977.1 enoyl-CoA hydratase [Nocardia sp. 852002-51244_SCH5132740]
MSNVAADAPVLIERNGEIAVVRLHRPDRLNAFTDDLCEAIIAAFDETDSDDTVRAVVLTGTGRAFCAGADLAAGGDTFVLGDDPDTGGAPADQGGRVALRVYRSHKPVIAAINGPAAGVGVTMTLPADIRIASDTAKFGFVFTRRGLVPEACSTWFLPRIVGISTALEWTLNGRMVSAREALDRGLVRELVAADQVLDRAVELARDMVSGTAPVSVALTRQLMWRMLGAGSPEIAHRAESVAIYLRGVSDDVREGVDAFLSKRDPQFPDAVSAGLPDLFGASAG